MLESLRAAPTMLLRPISLLRGYERKDLQPDLVAGLTVAVVLLPQGIVFALLAGLPAQMGLYAAIVAAIVAGLWGSSTQLHTGPTNSSSVLTLSILLPIAVPGSVTFIQAAGLLAVMAGGLRVVMGFAGLGMLVHFVSDSVIVGFTAGAGLLIIIGELRNLLRLEYAASGLPDVVRQLPIYVSDTHLSSLGLGIGSIVGLLLLRRLNRRLPGPLIVLGLSAAAVALFGLAAQGVRVIGELPAGLPPLAQLPLLHLDLIGNLSTGALAVGAIGLIEATSIARSISSQTGQQLNSNQEFVGQGLANVAVGLFSGYPVSGSFNRSALNYDADAKTQMATVFSGLFVLVGTLIVGPLIAFVPRASLAAVLIIGSAGMIDVKEMRRIWRGARGDASIMVVTFLATLLLPLQFAVLSGILMSLAYYILKTSTPQVRPVVPDENFRHFVYEPAKPVCPQLAVVDILGDLYFGAVSHVEDELRAIQRRNPGQRFLLLRMPNVGHCDISGIHMLESVLRLYRERGGDVYLTRVREPVLGVMRATGFYRNLGGDHFLNEDSAIEYLFYKVLDPAVCIYESDVRIFRECQNLPRPDFPVEIVLHTDIPTDSVDGVTPQDLWGQLRDEPRPRVIDVREPREFKQGHIAQAQSIPLHDLLGDEVDLPRDGPLVLVCRAGRRSTRAAHVLQHRGYDTCVLEGGMLAWEASGLLEALGDNEHA